MSVQPAMTNTVMSRQSAPTQRAAIPVLVPQGTWEMGGSVYREKMVFPTGDMTKHTLSCTASNLYS